jgi:hypothetical protein
MVVALVVLILLVLVWARLAGPGGESSAVRSVDWKAWVKAGRADQRLLVFAPAALPEGWKARAAKFTGGNEAHWRLAMLTDAGKYVGIEESYASTESLVEQYVDEDAERGGDVTVAGEVWQTWTDSGGDYALVRSVELGGRPYESVLVVGSAPDEQIREFVGTLTSGSVKLAG